MQLPEEAMLVAPNVGEEEPAHVRKSWDLWRLVLRVVSPDKRDKKCHHVDVVVGVTRHDSCDRDVKV